MKTNVTTQELYHVVLTSGSAYLYNDLENPVAGIFKYTQADGDIPMEIVVARANLLAAAPEMYAAIKALLPLASALCTKCLPGDMDMSGYDLAKAALAKAEGEPINS